MRVYHPRLLRYAHPYHRESLSVTVYCPHCEAPVFDKNLYEGQVIAYINTLPEEIKAPPEEYKRRLLICEGCEELTGHTCRLCGCYVEMRAAKHMLSCPQYRW